MSSEKPKQRILAALWHSPVLQILQTENLKRRNTRVFRVFSIHKSLNINELKQNGGKDQDRTGDTRIFSPLLYQLSYPATWDQYLIGYDSSNIHPFCDLSSRFLKKSRFFQAEECVVRGLAAEDDVSATLNIYSEL